MVLYEGKITKENPTGNLITLDSYQAMIDYDKVFNSVALEEDWVNATEAVPPYEPTGKLLYWSDLC